MRVLILTSSLYGTASHHLDALSGIENIEVAMVILNEGIIKNKRKRWLRKISKSFKIGILGVLNGVRMRKWYSGNLLKYMKIENLEKKCKDLNIPFYKTSSIGSKSTMDLFNKADVEIGISLGNSYIPEKIFRIPTLGMINVHHEILPEYQNAQSVIWQIYNGSPNTGYTIHKIDKNIDTGKILIKENIPIVFRATMSDSVTITYQKLLEKSAVGLVKLLENYEFYSNNSIVQKKGKVYTTPSFWQYLKMESQFRKLKKTFQRT